MSTRSQTLDTLTARLRRSRHWLFDMDGTLTLAAHDFDAMRRTLALPAGVPILEALAAMPAEAARRKRAELDALELDMAADSRPQPDAPCLLEALRAAGCSLGIVTRNGREIADATLRAAGLAHFFAAEAIVSRDCATAKPDPAGLQLVLDRWSAHASEAVMVGDYDFDLRAARAAGCLSVHLNVDDGQRWPEVTDLSVASLTELQRWFEADRRPSVPTS